METKLEVLQRVLSTELLGESVGKIAASLSLNTKATLYRIKEGSATEKTAAKVMEQLADLPGTSEELLRMMSATICKYEVLSNAIKNEKQVRAPQEVVADILAGDYSRFSEKFRTELMAPLETLRKNESTFLYYLLAYFYVKKSVITFYRKGMTHHERCVSILIPLTVTLSRRFPENPLALKIANSYESPAHTLYVDNAHIMLNCVSMITIILKYFGEPELSFSGEDGVQLYGAPYRTYWVNSEHTKLLMALYCDSGIIERHGYYTVFSIDARNDELHIVGKLLFYDDFEMTLLDTANNVYRGSYSIEEGDWTIDWGEERNDVIGMGNLWKMADLEKSASLTAYDQSLSDEKIMDTVIRDNGLELLPDYEVADVVISRFNVTLRLENGKELTIDRDSYHFFEHLSPDYPVLIARNVGDGVEYAIWGDMVHVVPLSAFKQASFK